MVKEGTLPRDAVRQVEARLNKAGCPDADFDAAELFRLAGKADHGPPHKPGQRRRQQDEYDDGQYGQRFFLLFGQRALHGRYLFFLYYPQDTTIFGKSCERNVKICL